LLAERPAATGLGVDQSGAALEVARRNAKRLGVADRAAFAEGDWFAPACGQADLIVCNPPYIPDADIAALDPDVRDWEPHAALAGGPDGLAPYCILASGLAAHLAPRGRALFEFGQGQAGDVARIFNQYGYSGQVLHRDLGGLERCLEIST
jgi:release factor glutamine methyltransferase